MNTKYLIISILLLSALITSTGCENKDEIQPKTPNPVNSITYKPSEKAPEKEKPVIVDIVDIDESMLTEPDDTEIDFLYEMQGYWTRPEGYELSGDDEFSVFLVESELCGWTPYFDGVAGQTLPCTGDLHGLHLEDVEGRITSYAYNGAELLNDDGSVAYVRIQDIPQ